MKKKRTALRRPFRTGWLVCGWGLDGDDVRRLETLRSLDHVELDRSTFRQSYRPAALDAVDAYHDEHYEAHLKPLLDYLKKQDPVVPLSEISDHFAFSQVHPGHLECACEWLEKKGLLEKVSAPFKLTKRSLERVEEPAYFLDASA